MLGGILFSGKFTNFTDLVVKKPNFSVLMMLRFLVKGLLSLQVSMELFTSSLPEFQLSCCEAIFHESKLCSRTINKISENPSSRFWIFQVPR